MTDTADRQEGKQATSSFDDLIQKRREHVADAITWAGGDAGEVALPGRPRIGIAFSGGGIRSATISLGMAKGLARRGRLYGIDIMSTVSGGGYFGSFLRSLYLPSELRGVPNPHQSEDAIKQAVRRRFVMADRTMKSRPDETDITVNYPDAEAEVMRNPVRWLRENGRYLAPNGATDFIQALSYIARNWIAMLSVFATALMAIFVATMIVSVPAVDAFNSHIADNPDVGFLHLPWVISDWTISPFANLAIAILIVGTGVGVGYWMTARMSYSPVAGASQHGRFASVWLLTLAMFAVALAIWDGLLDGPQWWQFGDFAAMPALFRHAFLGGIIILGITLISSLAAFWLRIETRGNPTPGMRRSLTQWMARLNQVAAAFLALAIIDTLAIATRDGRFGWVPAENPGGILSVAIYPLLAWVISKLPDWLGGGGGRITRWLTSHVSVLALVAGIFLFGSLAVAAATIVHMAYWTGAAWASAMDAHVWWVFAGTVAVLALVIGMSGGFINLSSLHGLYASRLTRAYIGATNTGRLKDAAIRATGRARSSAAPAHSEHSIRVGSVNDHIDARIYQEARLAAPVHIINLTLNQTRGHNLIVQRDRKGRRMAIGPDGITIGEGPNSWQWLAENRSEAFSIGQLCAISGAAASAGMGRRTTLGTALAMTYANVRLGYWWDRGVHRPPTRDPAKAAGAEPEPAQWWQTIGAWFAETFIYLFNEMTARYSLDYRRYYLTDGGHSENSGALELLRRGCDFIMVADNGEDPAFEFNDLEIFIRTARTDLGWEVEVASEAVTRKIVAEAKTASCFLNLSKKGWRAAAADKDGPAFALMLSARKIDQPRMPRVPIVWIKPRIFGGISPDTATYAAMNMPFPQQPTADQFFDEAQWESYRRMGYEMIRRLFEYSGSLPAVPVIFPNEVKRRR